MIKVNIYPNVSKILYKAENHWGKFNSLQNKYLIIKRECKNAPLGLFAFYITNIAWIDYALRNDYIPVIDMKNYENTFHRKDEVGKINTWEYYFKQPCGVSLDEALSSKNVRYVWNDIPEFHPNESLDFLYNQTIVDYYRNIASKYLLFNDDIQEYLDEMRIRFINDNVLKGQRVLGVLARGTDYTKLKPYFHPIQPSVDEIIAKVNLYRKKYDCSKIYVATEDAKILEKLRQEYGNDLLFTNQKRIYDTDTYLNYNNEFTQRTPMERGLDNLLSIYLLSLCNGIVAGRTSGTVGAFIMQKGFEFKYVFSIGRYGVEDKIIN